MELNILKKVSNNCLEVKSSKELNKDIKFIFSLLEVGDKTYKINSKDYEIYKHFKSKGVQFSKIEPCNLFTMYKAYLMYGVCLDTLGIESNKLRPDASFILDKRMEKLSWYSLVKMGSAYTTVNVNRYDKYIMVNLLQAVEEGDDVYSIPTNRLIALQKIVLLGRNPKDISMLDFDEYANTVTYRQLEKVI